MHLDISGQCQQLISALFVVIQIGHCASAKPHLEWWQKKWTKASLLPNCSKLFSTMIIRLLKCLNRVHVTERMQLMRYRPY